ncbi:MAG: hypothetical protein Q9163_000117 [Psora crenata]
MPLSTPAWRDDPSESRPTRTAICKLPVPSSEQPDQRESRSFGIQSLLNPVEGEQRLDESSAISSPSLSKSDPGLLVPLRSHVHSPPSVGSSPHRQVHQRAFSSQAQNCEHLRTANPESPQPASQSDSHSTTVQMPPSAKTLEVPTSSTAAHIQHQKITPEQELGPIQVLVDYQAGSKAADERRRKNSTASRRFRQRRKEKELWTSEMITKLKAKVRQTEKERDQYYTESNHYRTERDYFRDLAFRYRLHVAPRPPTPKRRCDEWSIPYAKSRS